jgi:amino acid adenylation domain-containing protein
MHADPGGPSDPAFVPFEAEGVEQSIPARFDAQATRHPDRRALAGVDRRLTYRELDRLTNRLARAIVARLGEGEEPVALLLPQGVLVVVAILAALKAGKIYVVLDPELPDARMAELLGDSQARLIVTAGSHLERARGLAREGQHVLDGDALDAAGSDAPLALSISADRGALILYTSGSTGRPKGVLHDHRNVLVETRTFTNAVRISPRDRLALAHSCAFSASVRSLFPALLNGATLFVYDLVTQGLPALARGLRADGITIWHTLATTFRRTCDALPPGATIPKLRVLRLGGEPINQDDVARYQKYCPPDCVLLHAMGPTETFVMRMSVVPRDWRGAGNVPLGQAIPDKEVLLLDEAGAEVAPGQIGEIAVRSNYLAVGYWRRPDLTQQAFRRDPRGGSERIYLTGDMGMMRPEGCLVHMGRKDFQVKIRGHRVEVGEVEVALLGLPSIKGAIVHARPGADGEARLVAYVILAPGAAPIVSQLRRALSQALPDYMVPSAFVFLETFPLLPTGKVDRRALPEPDTSRPHLDAPEVAPRTPIETQLAGLWADVLGVERVGIHDPFLDLGGNSLLAMRLLAGVVETFGAELSVQTLLNTPTVASMAEAIVQRLVEQAEPATIAQLLAELGQVRRE